MKNNVDIAELASNDACFDLQFRKDTRHERTNSPTYYRWKLQFVVTLPKEKAKLMKTIKRKIGCGAIYITNSQTRFSVQNINDISNLVVPFLKKNKLSGAKRKDFELWRKAADILKGNKGKNIASWKKSDLLSLIQIHKSMRIYKQNPRESKWLGLAKSMAKTS